ncbi:hypothetical protein RJT34_24484 [Clitoria ternatea]|uniref:Uncharacterized protein n=1 Tax=Clitoria ternatea TaxID=43366 RepID=A0AAN9IL93_CLITE
MTDSKVSVGQTTLHSFHSLSHFQIRFALETVRGKSNPLKEKTQPRKDPFWNHSFLRFSDQVSSHLNFPEKPFLVSDSPSIRS